MKKFLVLMAMFCLLFSISVFAEENAGAGATDAQNGAADSASGAVGVSPDNVTAVKEKLNDKIKDNLKEKLDALKEKTKQWNKQFNEKKTEWITAKDAFKEKLNVFKEVKQNKEATSVEKDDAKKLLHNHLRIALAKHIEIMENLTERRRAVLTGLKDKSFDERFDEVTSYIGDIKQNLADANAEKLSDYIKALKAATLKTNVMGRVIALRALGARIDNILFKGELTYKRSLDLIAKLETAGKDVTSLKVNIEAFKSELDAAKVSFETIKAKIKEVSQKALDETLTLDEVKTAFNETHALAQEVKHDFKSALEFLKTAIHEYLALQATSEAAEVEPVPETQ